MEGSGGSKNRDVSARSAVIISVQIACAIQLCNSPSIHPSLENPTRHSTQHPPSSSSSGCARWLKTQCLGDGAVGKSCFCLVVRGMPFPDGYYYSSSSDHSLCARVRGELLPIAVFDTSGGEDYDRLRALQYVLCVHPRPIPPPHAFHSQLPDRGLFLVVLLGGFAEFVREYSNQVAS